MRFLLLFAACVTALNAAVFQTTIFNTASLRGHAIKAGTLEKSSMLRAKCRNDHKQILFDTFDNFYLANITVGTPPQTFNVVPDTGSSTTLLIDAACNSLACIGHPQLGPRKRRYNTTMSSTFVKEKKNFSIDYKSGSWSGYYAHDVVDFAGFEIKNQTFGVATSVAKDFAYHPGHGVLGLGWSLLAEDNVVPPLQNILNQLDEPIFTVWMDRKVEISLGGVGGQITYGAFDKTNCEDSVNWVQLSSETAWQFPIDGFHISDYWIRMKHQAISDTGSSSIGVPRSYLTTIVKKANGYYDPESQFYVVPCFQAQTTAPLYFTIGGHEYKIPAFQYMIDVGLGHEMCALAFFEVDGGGFGPTWILGDPFIRTFCNVYDIGNKRIGFAYAKHSFQ